MSSKRPLGPVAHVVHDRVGHARDQVAADLHAVDLEQVRLDIPRREPAAVEREDLLVEPDEPALALRDDLRLKAAVTIPRGIDLDLAVLGDQCLRRSPVARVASAAGRLAVRLIADTLGQLGLHRAFHQPLGQLRQDPAGPGDLLLRRRAGQQLIDQLVADPPIRGHLQSLPDPAAARGPIHRLIDRAGRQPWGVRSGRAAPGLPSAQPSSLPLAGLVAGQPRRVPSSQSLKLQLGPTVLLGPAARYRRHSDLLLDRCLHRGSDTPSRGLDWSGSAPPAVFDAGVAVVMRSACGGSRAGDHVTERVDAYAQGR